MARYIEGQTLPLAQNASDDMLIFTAVVSTLIGIILVILGRLGKQMWMWVWGVGLIFCSIYLGFATYHQNPNLLVLFSELLPAAD